MWWVLGPRLGPCMFCIHCRAFQVPRLVMPVGNSKWKLAHGVGVYYLWSVVLHGSCDVATP